MAVKDHSLDGRIIEAARAEFMQYGYRKASLHKIAARAGLTTGALYTRYNGKDALFCSLIEEFLKEIQQQLPPIADNYSSAQEHGDAESILTAIQAEERFYLDILFQHYDSCVLFFCRSDGSSIEAMLNKMMEVKSSQTIDFLKNMAKKPFDTNGVRMILQEQFRFYRQILEKGLTKEEAMRCMETVEIFMNAGWKAFFEQIL